MLIFTLILIPLAMSAFQWFKTDRGLVSPFRKAAFSIALLLEVIGTCLLLAFCVQIQRRGGFGTDVSSLLRWTWTGFWISFSAAILSFSGKQRSRILSCFAAMTLVVIWILAAWGP